MKTGFSLSLCKLKENDKNVFISEELNPEAAKLARTITPKTASRVDSQPQKKQANARSKEEFVDWDEL